MEHYLYKSALQGPTVELYKIINGAHVNWPGFDPSTTNDFRAAQEIWRFFREHRACSFTGMAGDLSLNASVFPNPASGLVRISTNRFVSDAIAEVFDTQGRRLFTKAMNGSTINLDMTGLETGVYFVRIATSRNSTVVKLLIE